MIYAIANRKGGVGKTATARALCCGLASRGYRVLAVDADGQRNLTDAFETDAFETDADRATLYEVLTGAASATEAVQSTEGGVNIIPASYQLELLDAEADSMTLLRNALATLRDNYQYIVIDTAPSAGILTLNALAAADRLIIPCCADAESLEGLRQIAGLVRGVRSADNPSLVIDGVLLTRIKRSRLTDTMAALISAEAAEMETAVYDAQIRESVAVKVTYALRKPIASRKSNAAADYDLWINEVMRCIV